MICTHKISFASPLRKQNTIRTLNGAKQEVVDGMISERFVHINFRPRLLLINCIYFFPLSHNTKLCQTRSCVMFFFSSPRCLLILNDAKQEMVDGAKQEMVDGTIKLLSKNLFLKC